MKKLFLALSVAGFLTIGLSSCSKCAECSDDTAFYSGEYCKGNVVEDALYEAAKAECEALGGDFK